MLLLSSARADWLSPARVTDIYHAYDGTTVAFRIEGLTRSNCTCYPPWPVYLCLDRTRTSFGEELKMLHISKLAGTRLSANVDNTTCKVLAIGLDP